MAKSPVQNLFDDASSKVNTLLTAGGHIHLLTAIFSAFRGKEPKATDHAIVQAAYGWSGKGDEIALQRLLQMFRCSYGDSPQNKREADEAVEILTHFIRWNFLKARYKTTMGRVLSWWYLNQFRVLVAKLDGGTSSEEQPEKNTGVIFLKEVVRIIKKSPKRVDGYKNAIDYFEAWGIPVMPSPETVRALDGWISAIPNSLSGIGNWIDTEATRIERERVEMPWWKKILTF